MEPHPQDVGPASSEARHIARRELYRLIAYLTDELVYAITISSQEAKLADMPVLCWAADVSEEKSDTARGDIARGFLEDEVRQVEAPFRFVKEGLVVPVKLLQEDIYPILLGYGAWIDSHSSHSDPEVRRARVIELIATANRRQKNPWAVRTFRAEHGPQRRLLKHLAESIVSRAKAKVA